MNNSSQKIIESWQANASQWIATIEHEEIESRTLATNEAIIKTMASLSVKKVLDLGCGEGWLARTLRQQGMTVYGVDGIKELVQNAIEKDGPYYFHYNYKQLANLETDLPKPFEAVVINFALIDKDDTEQLIMSLSNYIERNGYVVIQTLHPLAVALNDNYTTGWKEGSWNGMKREFVLPYQWYFRTLQDWIELFDRSEFVLKSLYEPLHPQTQKPLSVIFVLQLNKSL